MRIEKVLHTNLLDPVPGLHAKRAGALTAMVSSLVHGAFLTVTSLGRRLQSPAKTKHNIKRADRTLSNKALQRDRLSIYRTLCARLCGHLKRFIGQGAFVPPGLLAAELRHVPARVRRAPDRSFQVVLLQAPGSSPVDLPYHSTCRLTTKPKVSPQN